MPELPDISVYVEALATRIVGETLVEVRVATPFLLRTAEPPLASSHGHVVTGVERLGKRVVIRLDHGVSHVIHLMIAGRLVWHDSPQAPPALRSRGALAAWDFSSGSLVLTEAGTKRRASLHVVGDEEALRALDPGGLEVLTCSLAQFQAALTRERRTLKRALTDPRILSGIGNAYSDEILFEARLSPVRLTDSLTTDEFATLLDATKSCLSSWTERLRTESGSAFPVHVTAFRPEMAVHGRAGEPCPRCSSPIQKIRFGDRETNYCATCQNAGRLLADRALSKLMRSDWPKSLDALEALKSAHRAGAPATRES